MKSLRVLNLSSCYLRAVPAFVGELESLEVLNLAWSDFEIDATTLEFLISGCPRLREAKLDKPKTPESRAHLEAFKARLRAENPDAKVSFTR